MSNKALFLDRDGVINIDHGYVYKIKDFDFVSGIFVLSRKAIQKGYKIFVITNQAGIARGYYSENDFEIITQWMIGQFKKKSINILDVYHCPHLPDSNCNCRKPQPGMLIEAQKKHNIDMKKSWLIGDKESDISAAINSGITNTILVKSGHKIDVHNSHAKYIIDSVHQSNQIIVN